MGLCSFWLSLFFDRFLNHLLHNNKSKISKDKTFLFHSLRNFLQLIILRIHKFSNLIIRILQQINRKSPLQKENILLIPINKRFIKYMQLFISTLHPFFFEQSRNIFYHILKLLFLLILIYELIEDEG